MKIFDDEIRNGINNGVAKRLSSPFYGYFLISWSLINWKLLYITIFISNEAIMEQTGSLKSDYIVDLFFSDKWKIVYNDFMYPLLLVIFLVWIFPYFTNIVFKKDKRNELDLEEIESKLKTSALKYKELILKQKKETERVKRDLEKDNPEILWENEYQEIKKIKSFRHDFWIIKDIIFNRDGNIKGALEVLGSQRALTVIKDYIFILISKDIVSYINSDNGYIELTEKGNYIMRRYIEEIQNYGAKKFGFRTGLG